MMMTDERTIKAPCVDDLNILKNIIQCLEYTSIPFSFIDERNLEKFEADSKISSGMHEEINEWKKQQGISHAKGFLQSIVSLLKSLDIIESTKIEKEDLDVPLGLSGPIMSLFIKKKVDAVKLTQLGYNLLNLLNVDDRKSKEEYDNILFWKFLHSNITHNFQRLIEDPNSYDNGVNEILKKFESDTRTIGIFLNWIRYFDFKGIGSDDVKSIILSKKKIIKKIISSTILELNTFEKGIHSIEILSNQISQQLDLSKTRVNFLIIFEIILSHIQSINENKKPIEGTSSSRDSLSLPNYPKIDMLKIHDSIPMDSILEHVTESELSSVLNLGGKIE